MKVLLLFLSVLVSIYGQGNEYQSYDWRPLQRIRSYPSYPSEPGYASQPAIPSQRENPRLSSYQVDQYPVGYQNSYGYGDNSAFYEDLYNYNPIPKKENFNITVEKYGGFGGTGDTRGFGAYESPKDNQYEEESPKPAVPDVYSELLNLGSSRSRFHRHRPLLRRPLPPPL
ncbi:uncharacterized protein LOC129217430 [Uloborus diversus]|uniref:uncharacterized protein LOC129217430 n=1 Tax=Uloborus diversus TaxID=327109 RepID=UPI00240A6680|nr:uncharacterized protein LOC129217430 [Uloborus diversus]